MALWNLLRVSLCAVLGIWTALDMCLKSDARMIDEEMASYYDEMTDHGRHRHGGKGEVKPFPRIVPDNGMFYFVLKDIAHELVKILEEEEGLSLSPRHRDRIHDKIESIYDRARNHPALESDRVAFSPKKPDYHLYTPDSALAGHASEQRAKRGGLGPYAEVCESVTNWEPMEFARLRNRTEVKVLSGFEFHITKCTWLSEESPCVGITSSQGATACHTTGTWVRALVCNRCNFNVDITCNQHCPDNRRDLYDWDWVFVKTCCKCAYQLGYY